MAHQMAADVQKELREIEGNNRCVDCNAPYPQWATVSYGTFMCLECSGRHRGLGVHLSFVRSVTMDGWTDEQIAKMQCGGNKVFIDAFAKANVPTSLSIAQKYNTPQAEAYRTQLTAKVTSPSTEIILPTWDPATQNPTTSSSSSSSDAMGVEALKGETEEQYVARQNKLKQEARERMAAKFGKSGLSSVGSNTSSNNSSDAISASLGSAFSMLSTTVSSAATSASSMVREQDLNSVKNTAATGWASFSSSATSLWQSASKKVQETLEESSDESAAAAGGMFFPRTNTEIKEGKMAAGFGSSASTEVVQPPASSGVPPPVPGVPSTLPSVPSSSVRASPPPVKQKPAAKKNDDFFGEFGM